jgi:predicted GNAT family acetyltransferase
MRLTVYPTAATFLDAIRPVLAEHEAEHHLVLGVAEAFAAKATPGMSPFAAVVEDDAGVALVAWLEQSHPLLLASDRATVLPAGDSVIDALSARGRTPRHVIGSVGQVEAFVDAWARRTNQPAHVAMRQRAYKLDAVAVLPAVPGHLRVATLDELDVVAGWKRAFEVEALGFLMKPEDRSRAQRRVEAGEIYLWCDDDGEPRSMAGVIRPTARGIAVNSVYTPREWRGRGYATACVAELSRRLLGSGFEFCVLYTDLGNPTSNAIYSRIGYRPVRDFLMYALGDRAPSG